MRPAGSGTSSYGLAGARVMPSWSGVAGEDSELHQPPVFRILSERMSLMAFSSVLRGESTTRLPFAQWSSSLRSDCSCDSIAWSVRSLSLSAINHPRRGGGSERARGSRRRGLSPGCKLTQNMRRFTIVRSPTRSSTSED